ncbi:MAG: aldose 1-epimerase [Ginsengibacter sp.]
MFSIQKKEENGFRKIILTDNISKTFAEIIPSCGAILHAFAADNKGEFLNVVESYESAQDFKVNVTAKGFRGSKLSPFVCRLNRGSYHFGEKDYKIEKYYMGESAIHGILYDKDFKITGETSNELHASVSMKYEYKAEDAGYPFNYDCVITWQLEKDNKLTVTTECINKDEGLIPMQDGWHPYFSLGDSIDDLQLEFQSKELVEFDEELLPTKNTIPYHDFNSLKKIGSTFLDNCFKLAMGDCQPLCVLRNPGAGIEVEIHPDQSYPYLQIYTPPHRRSIAIENLSGTPDAFNNGMGVTTLESGESVLFKTAYKIKILNT